MREGLESVSEGRVGFSYQKQERLNKVNSTKMNSEAKRFTVFRGK